MAQNKTDDKNLDRKEFSKENMEMESNTEEKMTSGETNQKADKAGEKGESVPGNSDEKCVNDQKSQEESLLSQKEKEIGELREQIQRLAAEFDNYKKRTKKEKEKIYASSVADVVSAFIPVVDNIERALQASEGSDEKIREGVLLIYKQVQEILSNFKVKPIEAKGKKFNPDFHEAVMHIDDENYGENEIVEEFLKGYIYNDEIVIRHSVVKVAN